MRLKAGKGKSKGRMNVDKNQEIYSDNKTTGKLLEKIRLMQQAFSAKYMFVNSKSQEGWIKHVKRMTELIMHVQTLIFNVIMIIWSNYFVIFVNFTLKHNPLLLISGVRMTKKLFNIRSVYIASNFYFLWRNSPNRA